METEEEESGTPKGFLIVLTLGALLIVGLVGASLAVPLQPGLGSGNTVVGNVLMPGGVGGNSKLNFEPRVITVYLGFNATVTWANRDTVKHTVTAQDNSFDSGNIQPGAIYTHTFTTPGNVSYYCIYHSSWMRATVIVKAGNVPNSFLVNIPSGSGANSQLNFTPSNVTLVAGVNNTVIFQNNDSGKHSVTAVDGSFNSGDILPGNSWSHTFAAGTYSYYCIYHSYMKGTIVVKSA